MFCSFAFCSDAAAARLGSSAENGRRQDHIEQNWRHARSRPKFLELKFKLQAIKPKGTMLHVCMLKLLDGSMYQTRRQKGLLALLAK